MVQTQTTTAIYRAQGEDRTAGRAVSATVTSDSPSFASLVQGTSGASAANAALPVTASTALKNDPEARTAGVSIEATQPASSGSDSTDGSATTSKHGGFWNFIVGVFDMLNPLEHIPVISTIYEKITGHKMSPAARIAGDTLYGGPIGAAVGVANVISEKKTGKDIGENVMAMFSKKSTDSAGATALASAAPAASASPATSTAATSTAAAGTPSAPGGIPWSGPTLQLKSDAAKASAAAAAKNGTDKSAADTNFAASNVVHHFRTTMQNYAHPDQQNFATAQASAVKQANPGLARPASPFAVAKQPAAPLTIPPATVSQGKAATPVLSTPSTPPAAPAPSTLNAVLSSQEAPADASQNQTVPPELIAKKMMASLDQYSAMKKGNMAPAIATTPGFSAAY